MFQGQWKSFCVISLGVLGCTILPLPTKAQLDITADGSIGTQVNYGSNTYTITGGQLQQGNTTLLHSFGDFSLLTNTDTAHFDLGNANTVTTVIGRVTGGNASTINGQIKLTGGSTPNLFLINPNGIVFGAGSSLNVPGSFIASTADSVVFANGERFGVDGTTPNPLLTVSAPVGLQLGANAGSLRVQGNLQVAAGHTLGLAGSQIDLTAARLAAPGGRIELWATQNAQITAHPQTGWQLVNSDTTPNWGTITLQQASLVDASGTSQGGAITIRGRGLTLQENSNIRSNTFAGQGQSITVNTTEFVELLGNVISTPSFFDGISTSVGNTRGILALPGPPATGQAGNVTIETRYLRMANGTGFGSATAGNNSRTGDVTVRATEVELLDYAGLQGSSTTSIFSLIAAGSNNQSGNVTVEAQRVRLMNGSRISSSVVFGSGQAGTVSIIAPESLEIRGANALGISSAVLSSLESSTMGQGGYISIDTGLLTLAKGGSITSEVAGFQFGFFGPLPGAQGIAGNIDIRARDVYVSDPIVDGYSRTITGITASLGNGAVGAGGNVNLTANRLVVFNGGQITTSSQGQGPAGSITVHANMIDVQGIAQAPVNGQYLSSTITASSSTAAAAGSVNLTTDALRVRDGGQVTVTNTGTGTAGNLTVTGGTIFLDQAGRLTASTGSGNGGNMTLQGLGLILRHGSVISATAGGAGNGGNISINAPVIVGFENSDIIANAFQGNGGNIQITTQGIFGLAFRPQLTPGNDITASSQFGVNGTVTINTPGIDPGSSLVELPVNLADSSQQIAKGCSANRGNSFIATGRGGVPMNPSARISRDRIWVDTRDLSTFVDQAPVEVPAVAANEPIQAIVEISHWRMNAAGQIELVADQPSLISANTYATCSG